MGRSSSLRGEPRLFPRAETLRALGGRVRAAAARMRHRARRQVRALAAGAPGERFERHYWLRRRLRREHPAVSLAYMGVGLGLIVVGALLSLFPPLPGILLGVPGVAMIVARFRFAAVALDRAEVGVRRVVALFRGWARRNPPSV